MHFQSIRGAKVLKKVTETHKCVMGWVGKFSKASSYILFLNSISILARQDTIQKQSCFISSTTRGHDLHLVSTFPDLIFAMLLSGWNFPTAVWTRLCRMPSLETGIIVTTAA